MALRVEKNWSSRRFLKEFASKAWCRSSLDQLIKKNRCWIFKICITPLLVVCSLHLQKIIFLHKSGYKTSENWLKSIMRLNKQLH